MSRRRYRDRSDREPNVGWRDRLPFRRPERYFQWRGQQVSRLEGLSDAVFGFALTLLVVAIEVPRTFDGLMQVVRDFPAFVACFALLMMFWNEHYRFFRRYGLEDWTTRCLNYVILLLVLFSVYPLKFLFSSLFGSIMGGAPVDTFATADQTRWVYRIYGGGFACLWAVYALLTWHALRLRGTLRLNAIEVVLTKLELNGFLIQIGVCLVSIGLTFMNVGLSIPGLSYFLLGPLMAANGFWHGHKVQRLLERETMSPLAA